MRGSSFGTVKAALVDHWSARPGLSGVSIAYDPPTTAADIRGLTGSYEHVGFGEGDRDARVVGTTENVVICSLPLRLDEQYDLPVVLQVFRPEDNSTRALDERIDELLGELLGTVAENPTLGIDGPFDYLYVQRATVTGRWSGWLNEGGRGRGGGAYLELDVRSRISWQ